jgi:hypothetical protein
LSKGTLVKTISLRQIPQFSIMSSMFWDFLISVSLMWAFPEALPTYVMFFRNQVASSLPYRAFPQSPELLPLLCTWQICLHSWLKWFWTSQAPCECRQISTRSSKHVLPLWMFQCTGGSSRYLWWRLPYAREPPSVTVYRSAGVGEPFKRLILNFENIEVLSSNGKASRLQKGTQLYFCIRNLIF